VGRKIMASVFADLGANAVRQAESVLAALPYRFPDALVTATLNGFKQRAKLITEQGKSLDDP
jgi:hypothetical protein